MKNLTLTILAVSTILTGSISSALADGHNDGTGSDVGTVQNSNQTSVLTGNGNNTSQSTQQINSTRVGKKTPGDTVSVQESDQYCDVLGHNNTCTQRSRQNNTIQRGHRNRNNADGFNSRDDD